MVRDEQRARKNRRLLLWGALVSVGMFGFGYALVPFYNVMCNALGVNGKVSTMVAVGSVPIDQSRLVRVEFITSRNANLPWSFYTETRKVDIHPGANTEIMFHARNNTDHAMTVQAIPSITPGVAAKYLKKTECFCFTQQTLLAGESIDMPVIFRLDPDLPSSVHELTLSYTLFVAPKQKQPVITNGVESKKIVPAAFRTAQ